MKNALLFSALFCLLLVFAMCENSEAPAASSKLKLIETELGGCNLEDNTRFKSDALDFPDTTIVSLINDTLSIYIGINYICCAPFSSSAEVVNDTIVISVTDNCSPSVDTCYCRCMCYYTWNVKYVNFVVGTYNYKVILNDPRVDVPMLFSEGSFIIEN